jgi:hypothetical protein
MNNNVFIQINIETMECVHILSDKMVLHKSPCVGQREEISKLCYKNHTMLLTIKSIEQHSSIMWSAIIVVVSLASATSAQVFGIGGCPTVTPQANFDLQQVSTGCETTI